MFPQMPQMMSQQGASQTPKLGGTPQQGPMSQSTMGGLQPRPQMPGFASMFSQQQQYPSQLPGFASMLSQQQAPSQLPEYARSYFDNMTQRAQTPQGMPQQLPGYAKPYFENLMQRGQAPQQMAQGSQLPGYASMLSQQQQAPQEIPSRAPSQQMIQQMLQRAQMPQAPNSTQMGAEAPRMMAMRYLQQLGG